MAFVPALGVAQVQLLWSYVSGVFLGQNVLYFKVPAGNFDAQQLADVISYLQTGINAYWKPDFSSSIKVSGFAARAMHVENGPVFSVGDSIVGTATGNVLPANVSYSIPFRTGLAGRSFRGRMFWPILTEAQVTSDFVVSPWDDGIAQDVESCMIDVAGNGFQHVVCSFFHNGAPRSSAVSTAVTSYRMTDFRVDTQKRRLLAP